MSAALGVAAINAVISALEMYHEASAEGALETVPIDLKRRLRAVMHLESEGLQAEIKHELERRERRDAADDGAADDLGELS